MRKNSLFKHSAYYMEGMCIAYSIKATLEANGVEDPTEWLNRYNRAMFKHIMEKGLEAQWRSTGELPKSFSIRNPAKVSGKPEDDPRYEFLPEQLTKGFDMKPWLDSIFNRSKWSTIIKTPVLVKRTGAVPTPSGPRHALLKRI